ncbi:hypothetical protein [Lysinibacillus xylanilyticus]|uniref:hypothetical protein n=1 Tax=Lysinibacillus xylanilyticus TaxID=582475 RepID=UPI00111210D9|nr:hypothetical protein [Lysinibacillus xylanilyticus]
MRKRSDSNNVLSARKRSVSDKCFICAKAKRQRQMFYLCESEAAATKRPSRNGNQPHVMVMNEPLIQMVNHYTS